MRSWRNGPRSSADGEHRTGGVDHPDRAWSRSLIDVGPMGELGALFNPGMRHEIEERKSKAVRREEDGTADPGDLRIDLFSGVAVIALTRPETGKDRTDEDAGADDSTDPSEASTDADDQRERQETPDE